jgi:LmbE family N-acetylglucosaminyl deacetylase
MLLHYDSIYLSPHLDDAALSCGGQIHAQTISGKKVLIVTIMAGAPLAETPSAFVQSMHERWELLSDTVARRRNEDIKACQLLGADHLHWEVPDCIYRLHPTTGEPIYSSWEEVTGSVNPTESALVEELAGRLADLPRHGRIFAPLSAGWHVDHQITREAAERCLGTSLFYYEDYPYVREPGALRAIISSDSTEWGSTVVPLSELELQAKIASIATYISQMSSFFADRADLEKQVRSFARHTGGERIWHRLTASSER